MLNYPISYKVAESNKRGLLHFWESEKVELAFDLKWELGGRDGFAGLDLLPDRCSFAALDATLILVVA